MDPIGRAENPDPHSPDASPFSCWLIGRSPAGAQRGKGPSPCDFMRNVSCDVPRCMRRAVCPASLLLPPRGAMRVLGSPVDLETFGGRSSCFGLRDIRPWGGAREKRRPRHRPSSRSELRAMNASRSFERPSARLSSRWRPPLQPAASALWTYRSFEALCIALSWLRGWSWWSTGGC